MAMALIFQQMWGSTTFKTTIQRAIDTSLALALLSPFPISSPYLCETRETRETLREKGYPRPSKGTSLSRIPGQGCLGKEQPSRRSVAPDRRRPPAFS